MKRKKNVRLGILLSVLALAIAGAALFFAVQRDEEVAAQSGAVEVVQDGNVLYRFTQEELQEERHIHVPYGEHENVIATGGGTIRIESADCPDQICVHMGELQKDGAPIICLPHRLEIRRVKAADAARSAGERSDESAAPDAVAR